MPPTRGNRTNTASTIDAPRRTPATEAAPQQRFKVEEDNDLPDEEDDDEEEDDDLDIFANSDASDPVLDLSGVDETQAKRKLWPGGDYDAVVSGVEYGKTTKAPARPMVTWTFDVTNDTIGETRKMRLWSLLTPEFLPRFKQLLAVLAPTMNMRQVRLNELADDLVGTPCRVKVGQDTPKGSDTTYNNIKRVMPAVEGSNYLDD